MKLDMMLSIRNKSSKTRKKPFLFLCVETRYDAEEEVICQTSSLRFCFYLKVFYSVWV